MNTQLLRLELDYLYLIEPINLVQNMDYDEFRDWVELGTCEDIECAIKEFKRSGLTEQVKIMQIALKNKS